MKTGCALALVSLLICGGCGSGGVTVDGIAIEVPTNLQGDWSWKIGIGCDLLPGFLSASDGDEIFPVTQTGLRLAADFTDRAGNRVVLDATLDGACVQGTYTITEGALRNLTFDSAECNTKAYTVSGSQLLNDARFVQGGGSFGNVQVIDLAAQQEIKTINLGTEPGRPCATPDGSLVFVPLPNDNQLAVIDTATDTVVSTISGTASEFVTPICCVATNDTVYVGNLLTLIDQGNVAVVDIGSRSVVNTIFTTGQGAVDMVLTPDGSELLVLNRNTRTIDHISTATQQETGIAIPLEFTPKSLDITPDGTRVVVVGDDGVMVCPLLSGDDSITHNISEFGGNDVRVNEDGTAFYYTHRRPLLVGNDDFPLVSGYALPGVTLIRTYYSFSFDEAYGIDLCGDHALVGLSSAGPTSAWDLTSTDRGGLTRASFTPSEWSVITQQQAPPPRVIVFSFKFFTAINLETGRAMMDGDLGLQSDTQPQGSCFTDSWTEVLANGFGG